MKQRRWRLGNHQALADFFEWASEAVKEAPLTVELVPEKRSLDQNSLIYALYGELAKQVEDQSVQDIRRECKLLIGVPILRASDEAFRALYDRAIKSALTYDEKLEAMDILPVTSRMNKRQAGEFINGVVRHYAQNGVYVESRDYPVAA